MSNKLKTAKSLNILIKNYAAMIKKGFFRAL